MRTWSLRIDPREPVTSHPSRTLPLFTLADSLSRSPAGEHRPIALALSRPDSRQPYSRAKAIAQKPMATAPNLSTLRRHRLFQDGRQLSETLARFASEVVLFQMSVGATQLFKLRAKRFPIQS